VAGAAAAAAAKIASKHPPALRLLLLLLLPRSHPCSERGSQDCRCRRDVRALTFLDSWSRGGTTLTADGIAT
jgi:hypothetical protein